MVWAVLAGALGAVANTLTIFAIRDVGLAIAFPLWNTNCLVGLFWGWLLFSELRGAGARTWAKVLGGAIAIVVSAGALSAASVGEGIAFSGRGVEWSNCRAWRGAPLGNDVCSLPQSLSFRDESPLLCHRLHLR